MTHDVFVFSTAGNVPELNNGQGKFIEDEPVQLVFPHAEECGGYQSVVREFNFVTHRKECCPPPFPPPMLAILVDTASRAHRENPNATAI